MGYMPIWRILEHATRSHEDPYGQAINLSSKTFSKPEFKTLGYNLNFIPTPGKLNKKQLEQDIKLFGRRIKLRDHFGVSQPVKQIFKSKSSWEPSEDHHMVKTFLDDFLK